MRYGFARPVFLGFLFLLFTTTYFAQEIPCLDARSGVSFVKVEKKRTLDGPCRQNRARRAGKKQARQPEGETFSISGHVTHQNGVRMSGVTFTLSEWPSGDNEQTTVTNENGEFRFEGLESATWELVPSKE